MKKIFLCVVLSLAWWQTQAQVELVPNNTTNDKVPPPIVLKDGTILERNEIYTVVQQMPTYMGGQEAMAKFLAKNLKYPKNAQEAGIEGKVWIRILIAKTGELADIQVLKGITNCPECNLEALRIVKMMPYWNPGIQNGNAVNVYYNLPVIFKLSN
jgi:protein TonB